MKSIKDAISRVSLLGDEIEALENFMACFSRPGSYLRVSSYHSGAPTMRLDGSLSSELLDTTGVIEKASLVMANKKQQKKELETLLTQLGRAVEPLINEDKTD